MSINTQRNSLLFLILFGVFAQLGCDNELDVNADWKEVPVVFGILDPNEPFNYVRVQKAFLGNEGDAFKWAKESDSLRLQNIAVKLIEIENGLTRREIPLELVNGDTIGLPKDSGIFANTPNYLYRCSEPIQPSRLGVIWSYRLIIHNENTGQIYSALSNIPGSVHVFAPFNGADPKVNFKTDESKMVVSYREGYQVKMYDFEARFRYIEYHIDDPTNRKLDSINWNMFSHKKTASLTAQRSKNIQVRGATLFELLNVKLEANPKIIREAVDMGFFFHGGGQELFTYIEVNEPSIGIVQKKPEYTNIEGGLGIFSGSHTSGFKHVGIADEMLNTLKTSELTAALNFQ